MNCITPHSNTRLKKYRLLYQSNKIDKKKQNISKENDLNLLVWKWFWSHLTKKSSVPAYALQYEASSCFRLIKLRFVCCYWTVADGRKVKILRKTQIAKMQKKKFDSQAEKYFTRVLNKRAKFRYWLNWWK